MDGEVLPADVAVVAMGPWSDAARAWLEGAAAPGAVPHITGCVRACVRVCVRACVRVCGRATVRAYMRPAVRIGGCKCVCLCMGVGARAPCMRDASCFPYTTCASPTRTHACIHCTLTSPLRTCKHTYTRVHSTRRRQKYHSVVLRPEQPVTNHM
mgnify:CR=1 FL=1